MWTPVSLFTARRIKGHERFAGTDGTRSKQAKPIRSPPKSHGEQDNGPNNARRGLDGEKPTRGEVSRPKHQARIAWTERRAHLATSILWGAVEASNTSGGRPISLTGTWFGATPPKASRRRPCGLALLHFRVGVGPPMHGKTPSGRLFDSSGSAGSEVISWTTNWLAIDGDTCPLVYCSREEKPSTRCEKMQGHYGQSERMPRAVQHQLRIST